MKSVKTTSPRFGASSIIIGFVAVLGLMVWLIVSSFLNVERMQAQIDDLVAIQLTKLNVLSDM
ncbi:MAG: hypothetical protein OEZ47_02860, partial [Gammaproteobacteria bacterium]|nr:hypothetical protein [Gammaproteobacteria bacterium]